MNTANSISTENDSLRRYVSVHGVPMAYVDIGEGDPIVFLHGNPTPSYLWRNIIPHALPFGRCLAPDYPGMGNSGAEPNGAYRFADQQRYVDGWFDALGLNENVILGLQIEQRNWRRKKGALPHLLDKKSPIQGIVRPFRSWDEWPQVTRAFFTGQRSEAGEKMILEQNLFVEYLLPLRGIPAEAIDVYRSHWRIPGEARRPMLSWTRDLPIAGEPADVVAIVEDYARFLSTSRIPKLFIDAEPGGFLIGPQREFCRAWPNQEQVTIKGAHFLQEETPDEVGEAIARFVAKVLAGQAA
jgi:haloalkane dehalogenase